MQFTDALGVQMGMLFKAFREGDSAAFSIYHQTRRRIENVGSMTHRPCSFPAQHGARCFTFSRIAMPRNLSSTEQSYRRLPLVSCAFLYSVKIFFSDRDRCSSAPQICSSVQFCGNQSCGFRMIYRRNVATCAHHLSHLKRSGSRPNSLVFVHRSKFISLPLGVSLRSSSSAAHIHFVTFKPAPQMPSVR